jgi:hypothetical protein
VLSGNCPAVVCTSTLTHRNTETGPDGRYSVSGLPAGSAALFFKSATHRQVCGAFAPLVVSSQLDLEITSRANPQPSPAPAPLRLTGQVYETTPAGRVPMAGASVYFDWYWDAFFFDVHAGQDGSYSACGIPSNWPMQFHVWQDGYDEAYGQVSFGTDTTLDIELKRAGIAVRSAVGRPVGRPSDHPIRRPD